MALEIGFKYSTAQSAGSILQAPTPPSGVITTQQQEQQQPRSVIYTTQHKFSAVGAPQFRSLSPTKTYNQSEDESRHLQSLSHKASASEERHHLARRYFADLPRMACFCLCCPIYKCVLWECLIELLISLLCWYNILNLLVETMDDVQVKDIVVIIFLTFWIITLFTSSGMLVLAERRKKAIYVLPRLIQQIGLLISFLALGFLLICYFSGARAAINEKIIWTYELFLDESLDQEQKREIGGQLSNIALLCVFLDIILICYVCCGLSMTKKYYEKMKNKHGSEFRPVNQHDQEPTAPEQPATNPYYKA